MKAVLCFSGGLDSTVLLWWLMERYEEVRCFSVDYGQRHRRELQAVLAIREFLRGKGQSHKTNLLVFHTMKLDGEVFAGSSQTSLDVPVPEGHYTNESMKQTVVPNRNMVLLSLATAWAISTKSDAVVYAAHKGDHAIYPDCRVEFINAMKSAVGLCDWNPPMLLAPFASLTKAQIVNEGQRLGVPFVLTWSCYKGGEVHCGKCGTCVERREAFQLAGVPDPTKYEG